MTDLYTSRDQHRTLRDSAVFVASADPHYGPAALAQSAPELPSGSASSNVACAVRNLLRDWGLDSTRYGTNQWNPLGDLIAPGSKVLLKPNLVLHENQSGEGLDCLITHPSLIEAVLEYVLLTRPASVTIGDAPIQGCDFDLLKQRAGLHELLERFEQRGVSLTLLDFRRTILLGYDGAGTGTARIEDQRTLDDYILFDLGETSLLEDLHQDAHKFRVTMYDPDRMLHTHAPGKHQYLVAREIIDADVVINLPKLKSHKKSCITGTLKNMVGMNGNKEFLPHHRKGGSSNGGDCYQGSSVWKSTAESLLDQANRQPSGTGQQMLVWMSDVLLRCGVRLGNDSNLEGSWHGNDTIWRTVLDLQRILHYGRPDASLDNTVQRVVLHFTDAVIGGDGEGPLAPQPVPSGFISGARNGAAAEWVHALLMGFDPSQVPLVRHAFDEFSYPLACFLPRDITVVRDGVQTPADHLPPPARPFRAPRGWQGHCEIVPLYAPALK